MWSSHTRDAPPGLAFVKWSSRGCATGGEGLGEGGADSEASGVGRVYRRIGLFERFVRRARHGNVPQVRRALGAGYAATRAVSDMWPDVSYIRLWRAIRVLSRDQSVLGGLSEGTEGVQHEFRIRRPRSFPASGVSSTRSAIRF